MSLRHLPNSSRSSFLVNSLLFSSATFSLSASVSKHWHVASITALLIKLNVCLEERN